jgi:hypothetical protein
MRQMLRSVRGSGLPGVETRRLLKVVQSPGTVASHTAEFAAKRKREGGLGVDSNRLIEILPRALRVAAPGACVSAKCERE